MALDRFYLTAAGYDLLARAQIGAGFKVTQAQIGEGIWSDGATYANISGLVAPLKELAISESKVEAGGRLKVTIQFTNSGIGRKFNWTEFGLWVADPDYPDDRSKDILYGTSYAGNEPVPVAAALTEFKYNVILKVEQAQNISVVIDDSLVYVTHDQVGVAGGMATLDENGKVPMEQINVGVANGIATLDDAGKVKEEQLPDGWRPSMVTIALNVGDWTGDEGPFMQTVNVPGVSADLMAQLIHVFPADMSQKAYFYAEVTCSAQAKNSLTFKCEQKPEINLTVYVIIQEVENT